MFTISELKLKLKELGKRIFKYGIALLAHNETNKTWVYITEDFVKKCKKGKVWNTPGMLSTLQNCWYGVDVTKMKSPGGKDGIFMINREYKPKNEMQRKIFDQFIDKEGSMFNNACLYFEKDPKDAIAVRIVSHHMRLLGILFRHENNDIFSNHIVLVDYDNSK
jgi:hypothetical protein